MAAGYWTAMADILTFPNGCVSLCFTLNAQEAQEKEFFHQLSGQNFFLQRLWLLLLQVLMLRNWISHFQNPRPVYLFLKILWTNTKSMGSYHLRFWHMMQKLGEQLRMFHPIFHPDSMPVWDFYFCPCLRTMPLSKNTAWVKTKWAIM